MLSVLFCVIVWFEKIAGRTGAQLNQTGNIFTSVNAVFRAVLVDPGAACKVQILNYRIMKIQVSKVFASFINQVAKDRNLNFSAEVVEIPSNSYGFLVGNIWAADMDYNFKTDKYKVIKIVYPYEYYCNPVFVSTDNLTRNFRRYGVKDIESLKDMICDLYAV